MQMKKLIAIGIIYLFIGIAVAPSINSTVVALKENIINKCDNPKNLLKNRYRVFGIGFVSFMGIINSFWHIQRHFSFGNSTVGWYYKAKLYIDNENDMNDQWYCLFIKDMNSKTVYNKTKLPLEFNIYNFTGYLSLYYYSIPHGAYGCGFKIFGVANDFKAASRE
jgi:hypothetical protein